MVPFGSGGVAWREEGHGEILAWGRKSAVGVGPRDGPGSTPPVVKDTGLYTQTLAREKISV